MGALAWSFLNGKMWEGAMAHRNRIWRAIRVSGAASESEV